ncbi:conserved protein of unknown function [Paenibacillus alvei]|uniref:Uncharacterized protein n=1 Tax=Paenibacillus alvei TaxID=44250 RepID=A0A383RF28_PAEAL|nr:conserved protein of unknown function [Paenibacillus alvei]
MTSRERTSKIPHGSIYLAMKGEGNVEGSPSHLRQLMYIRREDVSYTSGPPMSCCALNRLASCMHEKNQ